MELSDQSKVTLMSNSSEDLSSMNSNTENKFSNISSGDVFHKCFENGSMLVPLSFFPPGIVNITSNNSTDGHESTPLLMDPKVMRKFVILQI